MNTLIKNGLIMIIILIGITPLGYFVKVQYGQAQDSLEANSLIGEIDPIGRNLDNYAFGLGEFLQFDVGYGFINAGTATMEVVDLIEYNGRPAYRLLSTANSNKFFSSFYPVRDRVESIFDAIGLFSWHFDKELREGKYRARRVYSFDQVNHRTVYKGDTLEVAAYVQDALSVLYYIRTLDLKVGHTFYVDSFVDGRHFKLEVKVHRRESIKTDAGKFDCLVVEPIMQSAGVFKHEGKLTVWMTDDRLHLPVLMKSKVLVGSISAELTDYRLGELEQF